MKNKDRWYLVPAMPTTIIITGFLLKVLPELSPMFRFFIESVISAFSPTFKFH
jgi:hypothetical protein